LDRTLVAVTGASSGIGEVYARRLAPDHDLLLIARREERLDKLAHDLSTQYGCRAEPMVADLTSSDDLERVAHRLESDPALALLVNNAGFGTNGFFWEASWPEQKAMLDLHIQATARLTHAALNNMVPRNFGAVVNVASVASFVRGPGTACYSSSKSWIAAFTESVFLELKKRKSNVTVQALCPGYTYSEFHHRINLDPARVASPGWWHTAEDVVEQSIDGLSKRKLFVIPGWRYRVLTALVTRVPLSWRLFVELNGARGRNNALTSSPAAPKSLSEREAKRSGAPVPSPPEH
jgi:uncharacterized protein